MCGGAVNTPNSGSGGPGFRPRPSAIDKHPVQGGVAILLGMCYANETGMSAGFLGLWLMTAFAFFNLP